MSSLDDGFEIDIQPDVSALRMFRSMSFTPWFALGEFVDNSITSAMKFHEKLVALNGPDYRLRVKIDFPPGENSLTIEDNAAGISRQEMQRALRMGKAPQDVSVGLSRHGVGMKAAAFWWGARLEISTFPIDEEHGWKTIVDVSTEGDIATHVQVEAIPFRKSGPGTLVVISGLWQKTPQKRTKGAIKSYLPSIYRAFLGGGTGNADLTCEISYEGELLSFENPPLLNEPFWPTRFGPEPGAPSVLWRANFETILASGKRVNGWYGILESMQRDRAGFFLHYRGKGIAGVVPVLPDQTRAGHEGEGAKDAVARASYKPRKIFGQVGGYPDQSIIGEFDVSDFGKTISTDFPLWSPEEEEEFVSKLHENMSQGPDGSFRNMAKNYRRNLGKKAKQTQDEISAAGDLEGERIQVALSNFVEHIEVSDLPYVGYEAPPTLENENAKDNGLGKLELTKFALSDRDGHLHQFEMDFIADRSADFIGIYEEAGSHHHTVRVNQNHPILDDISPDTQVHILIARIAAGLAAAEVFLTMANKTRVRDFMNKYLTQIGNEVDNDQ
jgi:hypothetical protein